MASILSSIAEGIAGQKIQSEGLSTLEELHHVVKLEGYSIAHLLDKLVYHYGEPSELKQLSEQ